jgi:tetratricopeptide (TPR) repeat protein
MKKWALLFCLTLGILSIPGHLLAKEKETYAMSMKVFKKMEKANLLVEEENFPEALSVLEELLQTRTSKYEKAQINSLIGLIHYRNSDQSSALEAFARVLESAGNMPLALHQQTLKTLTQLSMIKEDYRKSKQYCEQLIAIAEQPSQLDYALLAQSNYKLDDWDAALAAALDGRKLAYEQQKSPDENLLLLLNAIYYEKQEMHQMPAVLQEIIKHYPKSSYLLYLASVYGQLDQSDRQLILMESLYEDGRIDKGPQLRNLVSLYMSEKVPYKGALVLQKALDSGLVDSDSKNWALLAQAWRMAAQREQAIEAITQAAKLSEDGKNYLQAAYMYFDLAQWQGAERALMSGFDKGLDDKTSGEAWLLLGMTRFKMHQFETAIEACEKAKKFKKSAKHAEQWIEYIANEKTKFESMQGVQM